MAAAARAAETEDALAAAAADAVTGAGPAPPAYIPPPRDVSTHEKRARRLAPPRGRHDVRPNAATPRLARREPYACATLSRAGWGGAAARGAAHAQYGGASRGLGQRLAGRSRCAAAALLPAARTAQLGSARRCPRVCGACRPPRVIRSPQWRLQAPRWLRSARPSSPPRERRGSVPRSPPGRSPRAEAAGRLCEAPARGLRGRRWAGGPLKQKRSEQLPGLPPCGPGSALRERCDRLLSAACRQAASHVALRCAEAACRYGGRREWGRGREVRAGFGRRWAARGRSRTALCRSASAPLRPSAPRRGAVHFRGTIGTAPCCSLRPWQPSHGGTLRSWGFD